jgi:phosphatidate cytidylyltransferase
MTVPSGPGPAPPQDETMPPITTPPAGAAPPPPGRGRRDLLPRLATAAAGIPIVLAVIVVGGPLYVAVAAALLALGAFEIYHAARLRASDPLALCGMAAVAAMAAAAHVRPEARSAALTALVMATLAIQVVRAEIASGFARWAEVVGGAAYVGLLGSYLVALRFLPEGRGWVLLMIFTTFATDTGAFFVGRAIGRRKLAPRVSPGKTVAGAAGGLAAGAGAAVALNVVLGLGAHPAAMLLLGVAVVVAAEFGDLGESLLKRALGVKDMGHIFPGHGGVLDRLDSVLFAAPVVYYAVRWLSL